jgi:hypothetical protein
MGQLSVSSTNEGIIRCLSRLPQLIDLDIECRTGTFPCISSFKGLQRLSVSGIDSGCDGLSTLVANSPGLSHLNIAARRPRIRTPTPLLPDIFALLPPGRTMSIRSLGLSYFQMHIKSDMLPHLRSLESYRLHHHRPISHQFSGPPRFQNTISWNSLRISGVHLRHLDVDYVDNALVDYLASSSGLETLRFELSPHESDFPKGLAYGFFTAMSGHAKSLKSLFVLVSSSSDWCFHVDYINPLLLCKELKMLSMSIAFLWDDLQSHRLDVVRPNI